MEQRYLSAEASDPVVGPSANASQLTRHDQSPAGHAAALETEVDEVETLGAELSQAISRNQKREDRAIWSAPVFYALMTAIALVARPALGDERVPAIVPFISVPLVLFWIAMSLWLVISIVRPRKRLRQMARTLADTGDVRAIGPLVDALKIQDLEAHRIATYGLTILLPRLRPANADLLNAQHRDALAGILNKPPNRFAGRARLPIEPDSIAVSIRVAILRAFTQIGEPRVLPIVARLASEEATTDGQRRIQEEARECLPVLKARAEQALSSHTLLRAAEGPADLGGTLLRAAAGTDVTEPDQLLRPSQ
jgi:hypothetical protein